MVSLAAAASIRPKPAEPEPKPATLRRQQSCDELGEYPLVNPPKRAWLHKILRHFCQQRMHKRLKFFIQGEHFLRTADAA